MASDVLPPLRLFPVLPLLGILLLTASCGVPGLRTSSAGSLALLAETDSLAIHEAAKADQKAFEILRRSRMLMLAQGTDTYPRCMEVIGRYCMEAPVGSVARIRPPTEHRDVARARTVLLEGLGAAAGRLPGDRWIQGQRVRYLVDGEDGEGAVAALSGCAVNPLWWCNALLGYALHHAGRPAEAEGVFRMTLAAMTPGERSAWLSPYLVLDEEDRADYLALPQEESGLAGAQFWMLADPLWTRPGNEIFSEHLSRWIETDLLLDTEPIEGSPWGEDLIVTMIRYGRSDQWIRGVGANARASFVRRQISMIDLWSHLDAGPEQYLSVYGESGGQSLSVDPIEAFDEQTSLWNLAVPSRDPDPERRWAPRRGIRDLILLYRVPARSLLPPSEVLYAERVTEGEWDGEESFPLTGYAVPIGGTDARWFAPVAHQVAIFPRGDSVMVVATYDLPAHGFSREVVVEAGLALFPSGGELGGLQLAIAENSRGTGVLTLTAEAVPALLSLELIVPEEGAVARTRYGIDLSRPSDGPAFSDLLLLRAGELPESLLEAIEAARPSTRVAPGEPLGIFWEIHGLDLLDLTEISMSLTLHPPPRSGLVGFLRGLGESIGVIDQVQPTRTNWIEEVDPGPSMARSLGFGFPDATEGTHIVELRAELPGREPLVILQEIEVTRATRPQPRSTTLVRRPLLSRIASGCDAGTVDRECAAERNDPSIYGHYGGTLHPATFGYDGW